MWHINEPTEGTAQPTEQHFHKDKQGVIHACYHKCKSVFTDFGFWLGVTLSFPLEHWIWHELPGFRHIAEWMGL